MYQAKPEQGLPGNTYRVFSTRQARSLRFLFPDGKGQKERYNERVSQGMAMMLNKQEIQVHFSRTVLIVSSKGKGNTLTASFASFLLSFMQVMHPLTLTPSVPSHHRTENYIILQDAIVMQGSRACGQYEAARNGRHTLFDK